MHSLLSVFSVVSARHGSRLGGPRQGRGPPSSLALTALLLRRCYANDDRGIIRWERRSRCGAIVSAVVIRRGSRHRVFHLSGTLAYPSHKITAVVASRGDRKRQPT